MVDFQKLVQEQFNKMCSTGKLFRSKLTGQEVWDLYISNFNKEDNPIFRDPNSSYHNCNHCKNFIRRYGNVVSIDADYNIVTMFDVDTDSKFSNPAKAISKALKESKISEVFFETFEELNKLPYESCSKKNEVFRLGIDKNVKRYTKEEAEKFGVVKPNELKTFNHLHLSLPKQFVDMSGSSVEQVMAKYRDDKNVFKRAMDEISLDTLNLVKDLVNQGSLLDAQAHLQKVPSIVPLKAEYDTIENSKKDNWCWIKSYKFQYAKFKNELIGVLCSELSEGKDLNEACKAWNKRVDPSNYMKAVAPIPELKKNLTRKFVEENGYTESFNRRLATIDDIKASEILHLGSNGVGVKNVSIFDNVKTASTRHKRSEFDGVEEVSIDKFITDILPSCSSVEAYLSNKHENNMVTMTTSANKDSKPMFKWSNNYSWTYNGNLAGKSQIKQAVKDAGGKVDGIVRFSIIWNETDGKDNSDLDAWCIQPDGQRIGYDTGFRKDRGNVLSSCKGQLDLDITNPSGKVAVENIYFLSKDYLKEGTYAFFVNQFSERNSQGFRAEIEVDGDIYSYEFYNPVTHKSNVQVAEVVYKNGKFDIMHKLKESSQEREIYGLSSEKFHKVNLVCKSPNHWNNEEIGNKHYFFMLEGCKCPNMLRTFHSENLNSELIPHRDVLEFLGNTIMVGSDAEQLSGLGFNATVKDELVVKLQGSFKRTIKIKF